MTAPINLEETYNELSNLLKDVCSFLNKEVQNGTMSAAAASQAQKLVERLKKQEEVVSQISILQESTNSNYPYLQMQRPSLIEEPLSEYVDAESTNHYEEEDYEETENYAEVSLPPVTSIIMKEEVCPFLDLPLSMLSQEAVKCGPLIRKERFLIIEQKKQLFVGLVGYWLLIYSVSKKDMKPIQVVNVTEYRAFAKKDPIFEIICEDKKTHEFIAKSAKDMDQWVVAINCKKQPNPLYARNLPSVPAIPDGTAEIDSFDDSTNSAEIVEADPEDIYENVDDVRRTDSIKVNAAPPVVHVDSDDDAPTLPARQQTNYPKRTERASTDSSTYNNVTVMPMEEEDDIYDPVQNGQIEEEEEMYDEPKMPETIETFNKQVKVPFLEKNKESMSINHRVSQQIERPPTLEMNKQLRLTFDLRKNNPKSPVLQTNDYDNEEEEDSYDIPRSDNFNQQQKSPLPPVNNNDDYEEEDVEYDELKIVPQNNNVKAEQPKPNLKVDITPEKNKAKPVITSPKPKLQGNTKKIHNIIQHMEASLTFKGKN